MVEYNELKREKLSCEDFNGGSLEERSRREPRDGEEVARAMEAMAAGSNLMQCSKKQRHAEGGGMRIQSKREGNLQGYCGPSDIEWTVMIVIRDVRPRL